MEIDYTLCIFLGLLIVILSGNVGANNVQQFLIEPQDMEVDQGTDVTFQCRVNFLSHNQILAWLALDRQVTSDSTIIAQREDGDYAVNVISSTFINLVLNNVQPSDDGIYSCAVLHRHTQAVVLQSRIAILIVNFLPDSRDPICTPMIATVHVNDLVTITCDSKTGKPPVQLVWTRADGMLIDNDNVTLTTVNLRTILTYKFVATHADQGAIFRCTATSQRFPHYLKRCKVTVDVQFPPKVNISTVPPDEDQDFPSYNCTAIANPDAFTPYEWEINPPFQDTTSIISLDGTILSFDAKPICREITRGTCTATNIKGSGNDTVIICEPLPTTMPPPTSKISAGRGQPGDGSTTTIVIIILLLLVLFAVLGFGFMYRRKKRREREQLLTSQPPQNINITVDPHININISGAETLCRGNLQEGDDIDNLGINPAIEDESYYLPMGDVKSKTPDIKTNSTVTSNTKISATNENGYPEDTYIDGYNVQENISISGLKPHPKTRKGKLSPKPMPKPRAAPRTPIPHPRKISKKGFIQALRNGFTFKRKRTTHDKDNLDMDDPKADYELYKKGEDNVYAGLKPHQDTDDENDGIWDDKKKLQDKFVKEEGAYDLASALRIKVPESNSEAKVCNKIDSTNYYSPVADEASDTKSASMIDDHEEYINAELYGDGVNNANQSHPQSALLALKSEEVSTKNVEGDYDLVGPMRVKPQSSKSATTVEESPSSRQEGEVYTEAKLYGGIPSAVGTNKLGNKDQASHEEGQVYAEAKMYGAVGQSHNKLELRNSLEVSQDVDAEGGGFGKLVKQSFGRAGINAEDDDGGIYQQANLNVGHAGALSKTSLTNSKVEEDCDMLYEEPIRGKTSDPTRFAGIEDDHSDNEMLYEEPISKYQTTSASKSAIKQIDEPDSNELYEEPITYSKSNANHSMNIPQQKLEDGDDDMIYQEATLYGATAASTTTTNISSKAAVFADNPDGNLDSEQPEDESIYQEATFYRGVTPTKQDHPKIPEKPVVGKKSATLVRNDMEPSDFAEPEDGGISTENDSEEDESVYAEATIYGSVESGRPHKPPVATPRKQKVVAKKSATLVRQDSDDF
ncbi:uncharacterized protein LOC129275144 [Lytechinus pictus]|uniref:uncharacterized protein LOC129275144 n=1 Tax=Lytechinus pictus TaxID=7653 RepID=UPI0030B9D32F